jgi:hypothetical protein
MFPFACILQHYVKFDIHTIVMLEKLLGVGSFNCSIGHLVHRQTILLVFLGGFGLPFVDWTVALAFLGCWALIAFALVIHYQQDDHPIVLDALTHVEITFSCSIW